MCNLNKAYTTYTRAGSYIITLSSLTDSWHMPAVLDCTKSLSVLQPAVDKQKKVRSNNKKKQGL